MSTSSSCSAAWTRAVSVSSVSSGRIGTTARGEHRAVVDAFVGDEVDHHAGRRALAGERLVPGPLDGAGAGQLAGQRRVEVDDAVGEPAEEAHREDAHPPGEDDEVGAEAGDDVGEAGVVVGPRPRRRGGATWHGRDAGGAGPGERAGVGAVGDDGDDLGRRAGRRRRRR